MVADLRKQQYYFFFFLTVYLATGVGSLTLANIWLSQSVSGAPREAVISRAIEQVREELD
ncbi:hypothetical protein EDD21DRAFT_421812 [Dissophora ornata]|nr:hypothetical protein EDD21DRAFT_421812 [Dissophora ornata]